MSEEKRLDMYGGILGGTVPLAVLIIGLVWLCLAERGGTQPFWACAWLALVIGLFFARKKEDYCLAAMRGIGDENGIVIITAWLFAGVFGQLMAAGGLVDGLLWMGMSTGAQGSIFVGLVCSTLPAISWVPTRPCSVWPSFPVRPLATTFPPLLIRPSFPPIPRARP